MYRSHLSGEPQPFQPAHQEVGCIAVLGEDDELLAGIVWITQYLAQLLELRLLSLVVETAGHLQQFLDLASFDQ